MYPPRPPPKPRRHSEDNQPGIQLPIPPPKPKTLHTSDHMHTLDRPCDCGLSEERTVIPVRDVTFEVGGCGEETTEKDPYSYVVVRGTESQTAKKPQNPRFPKNVKRRLASGVRRRMNHRAPAAVPRPTHTMDPEQQLDIRDGDNDGDDYVSIHGASLEISDDSSCTYANLETDSLYENFNNSVYENIDLTPGQYQNLEEVLHSQASAAGQGPEAEERAAEDGVIVSPEIEDERRAVAGQRDEGGSAKQNLYDNVFEGPYENFSVSGWELELKYK